MLVGTTAALLGAVSLASGRSAAADETRGSELLMACAEFHRTQAELDHWYATGYELEPPNRETEAHRIWQAEYDRYFNANVDAFAAVDDTPATTQAGVAAKSKVLVEYMRRAVVNLDGSMSGASPSEDFAYKLAQEATRLAGGAA